MLAAVLALALSAAPAQQTAAWGDDEWRNGVGMLSAHYFRNGTGFPSGHELENGTRAGSFHHLIFGIRLGSAYFWDNETGTGSAYFWRNGVGPGSRYYWRNGQHCLSDHGWRNGAICDGREILTFQSLCVARAIDVAPCDAINARLEVWLSRDADPFSGAPGPSAEAVARMRGAVE
ncbi:hypothetical protein N0B44_28840 [Roseibacterium beibuensis]|uniref:hypothetical protein n=1 Tax=[Roseibacterium] beibuensis TaxID=1193142 RepID=UPI00217EE789|nr:hypothetical protein [Roseibacterium beibuensis]MCS6626931.1 hypothetical protein [Roseibacterium beibuensis]